MSNTAVVVLSAHDLQDALREVLRDELARLPNTEPDPWMTVDQAADYLVLTKGAVSALISRGKLTCHLSATRRRRIRRSDADRYQTGGDMTS